MVDDSRALAARVQSLLVAEGSSHRQTLNALALDAVLNAPCKRVLGDPDLGAIIVDGLTEESARAVVEALRPALDRIQQGVNARDDRLRDLLPESAVPALAELIASGRGPRFGWFRGAVDPALLRQLFAPVVQDTLLAFAHNLPVFGAESAAVVEGTAGGGRGSFVGSFAKQVSRGAGQLAGFGKGVMGGLGAELERRMQAVARDFSQTAMGRARESVKTRLQSDEGRSILARIREQSLTHVLDTPVSKVVDDFMHLPVDDIAALIPSVIDHNRRHELVPALIAGEVQALLTLMGDSSLAELLDQAGLLERTRALGLRALDGPTSQLVASDAFAVWLGALLDEA